jgi:hypothetical protein
MAEEWKADVARKSLLDHVLPPPGFHFAAASDRDRARYGFPVEPKDIPPDRPRAAVFLTGSYGRRLLRHRISDQVGPCHNR